MLELTEHYISDGEYLAVATKTELNYYMVTLYFYVGPSSGTGGTSANQTKGRP